MLCCAVMNAQTSTMDKPESHFINACSNIEEPPRQDSAVHLHLQDKSHSFEDANVHILDREDRCLKEELKNQAVSTANDHL